MTTRGGGFQKGQSGNPAGRPKGSRAKTALKLDAILEGEAEAVTRKAIEMAKAGDTVALRLCLDRLCPPRKDRHVTFTLPPIETAADLPRASGALLQAVAAGELTPSEAADFGNAIRAHVAAIEAHQHAADLAEIREALAKQGILSRV